MIADLGSYSLFLGVNYPIIMPVGGADLASGYLTRSNCVYTLPNAVWSSKSWFPEICRFSLNAEDEAIGFQTNVLEGLQLLHAQGKTPLWFIPSFANALDWNRTDI